MVMRPSKGGVLQRSRNVIRSCSMVGFMDESVAISVKKLLKTYKLKPSAMLMVQAAECCRNEIFGPKLCDYTSSNPLCSSEKRSYVKT